MLVEIVALVNIAGGDSVSGRRRDLVRVVEVIADRAIHVKF